MITVKAPVTLPRAGDSPFFRDKVWVVGGGGKEEEVKIAVANYDLAVANYDLIVVWEANEAGLQLNWPKEVEMRRFLGSTMWNEYGKMPEKESRGHERAD